MSGRKLILGVRIQGRGDGGKGEKPTDESILQRELSG
jgi:hypothetical protein